MSASPPVLGFAAWSGTGKTTLLTRLLPLFTARGLRVGMVKHAHHAFDIDQPGKDSWLLRQAGASQTLIASSRRWALMVERPAEASGQRDLELEDLVARLDTGALDLILVEGFKHAPVPKIEVHRPSLGRPLLAPGDPHIVAVATDAPLAPEPAVPLLDLNDPPAIARFILQRLAPGALAP